MRLLNENELRTVQGGNFDELIQIAPAWGFVTFLVSAFFVPHISIALGLGILATELTLFLGMW